MNTADTTAEPFVLENDKPAWEPWQPAGQPKGKQKMLFTGLDLLPGQLDLFEEGE